MNIKELREITQSNKRVIPRPWFYWSLQRGVSIYITRVLIHTSITPTTITVIGLLVSIAGVVLIGMHNILIGLALLYIGILLDKADGELARYKKQFSLRGIYLDYINHLVIPPLFFIAFGIATGTLIPYGILASFASILIRAEWGIPAQIFAKKYIKSPQRFENPNNKIHASPAGGQNPKRLVFFPVRVFHQFQDLLITLIVVLIALLFGQIYWVVVAYGAYLPVIFIENTIKGIYGITTAVQKFNTHA